jgi:hypothetical protein
MNIKSQGIYFNQIDQKETGYYTQNIDGNLVHHNYEKPSFWQRLKYFVRYGREMNMNTIFTSYFYFSPRNEKLTFGSILGDAITVAKEFNKSRAFGMWHPYKKDSNQLYFETDSRSFFIDFVEDESCFKLTSVDKKNHTKYSKIYHYLDWDKV